MAHYDPPGLNILLHNQGGLRIEFNADYEGTLTIWFSPLAGQSIDYRERNFSNRDDHTSVFDKITLPGLSRASFVDCDYDPFHTVVSFKPQKLHLLPHFSEPALILWTETPQSIDIKTGPNDAEPSREPTRFSTLHLDRWHRFTFIACIGKDRKSTFTHQRLSDRGRSHYVRVNLQPSEPLVLLASLKGESQQTLVADLANRETESLLEESQNAVNAALKTGSLQLRGHPTWTKLHEICKKHLLSARDRSGAVRAALNRIYYLIWVRDGAFIENNIAASGWDFGAGRWSHFLLANPTVVENPDNPGRAFLMLVNQLTKREEDGLFYAVWSAFSTWTQWATSPSIAEKTALQDAMSWLENYCFDHERGLFGRYYACESPFYNSFDFAFDNATGKPCDTPAPRSASGKRVLRSYDVYINETAFSAYCMLAALLPAGDLADSYLAKAKNVRERMRPWFDSDLPPYGLLLLEDHSEEIAPPYGLDLTDYVWAFTAPPICSHPHKIDEIRKRLLTESQSHAREYFLSGYFTLLSSLDTWTIEETSIEKAIDYAVRQSTPPGSVLPMPYAIKEKLDVVDGDRWHDVRPQAFSAGPFLTCMSSLLLRRLPFGLAIRPSGIVDQLTSYAYRGCLIDVQNHCDQSQQNVDIQLNGSPLLHTLQIPESLLKSDTNHIELHPGETQSTGPLLLSSTVRLISITSLADGICYEIETYGFNTMQFQGINLHLEIRQITTQLETHESDLQTVINFWGRGTFQVYHKIPEPKSAIALLRSSG